MSCGNCKKQFSETVPKTDKILSTWNLNVNIEPKQFFIQGAPEAGPFTSSKIDAVLTSTDENDTLPPVGMETEVTDLILVTPTSIPIYEALCIIFEVPPLLSRSKDYSDIIDSVHIFKNNSSDYLNPKANLKVVGNSVGEEGDKDIIEPHHLNYSPFDFCSECAETLTVLYNSFKDFTQICKLESEVAKKLQALEDLREDRDVKGVPTTRKRKRKQTVRKKPKSKVNAKKLAKTTGSGDGGDAIVKKEIQSGCDLSDVEDYYYSGGDTGRRGVRGGSISSSPPDSPVNLDFNEVPRSPRPVRNSSARTKNWASFYKDELLEDEDEEEAVTEVVAEAEATDSKTMELLENVQVEWQEEKDQDYDPALLFDDDDDDEEYKPDSDLEELMSAAEEGQKKPKRVKLSRRHTSMFKSINRSLKNLARRTSSDNFECPECGKLFAHKKSLERHCRTHTEDDGSVQCPTCNKLFSRDDHLKRHRRKVHGEDIPFRTRREEGEIEREPSIKSECPICQKTFSKNEIEDHVLEHKVENPWKCKNCPIQFATLNELSKHKTIHYERQKSKCDVCEKEFRSTYHLKRHQMSIHHARSDKPSFDISSSEEEGEDEEDQEDQTFLDEQGNVILSVPKERKKKKLPKMFKCQECGRKYAKQEKLTEHLISHGIGERHRCEICSREFNHIRSKQRHMFLHSTDNPHKCPEAGCDKGFSRRDHLVRHLQSVHGSDIRDENLPENTTEKKTRKPREKEVQCPHCDKVIKRERLRLHMVIHTGEKRHVCDLCGQKFGLRTTLLTHIQCVHQGVRRYTCTYCGQAFKRSNHLKDHEKLHTDADSKPFACQVCGKAFRREKNLKSHMICHGGSKDYMCELCGKAFNRIDNMRAHVKTVHQGLQIRKKKIKPGQNVVISTTEDVVTGSISEELGIPAQPITIEVAESSSVIVKTRQPPRKRASRAKNLPPITVETAPATVVTLSVDPTNVIPGEVIEHVQIQEVREGEEDSNNSYEPQRTTIVQLAPGQVIPQNPGAFQGNYTTFYQYTYF